MKNKLFKKYKLNNKLNKRMESKRIKISKIKVKKVKVKINRINRQRKMSKIFSFVIDL
jgi:hypothetical protein